jgi:hypothetical protein
MPKTKYVLPRPRGGGKFDDRMTVGMGKFKPKKKGKAPPKGKV